MKKRNDDINYLITLIGQHDCEMSLNSKEPLGPIETILNKNQQKIHKVFALYQPVYVEKHMLDVKKFKKRLEAEYNCIMFLIEIDNNCKISDIGIAHDLLRRILSRLLSNKTPRLFFNTSSGTNATSISLIMLGRTEYKATLLQTWTDEKKQKSSVEEVNFPFQINYEILKKQLPIDTQLKRSVLYNDKSVSPIIGECETIKEATRNIIKYSIFDRNVLIVGESGTGKELYASLYVNHSNRQKSKYFSFNCANFSEDLAESELFGHKKGAYTGAVEDKDGLFKTANGGILFLDEIGELSSRLQAKLLRFLENGVIQPLGSDASNSFKVNVRIICATNNPRNLRLDLYYRLAEGVLELPPLRERGNDSTIIADQVLKATNIELLKLADESKNLTISYQSKTFDKSAYGFIQEYSWEGNVRELITIIKRCCILSEDSMISYETMKRECNKRFFDREFEQEISLPLQPGATYKVTQKCNLMDEIEKIKLGIINESVKTQKNKTDAAIFLGFNTLQAMRNHLKNSKAQS